MRVVHPEKKRKYIHQNRMLHYREVENMPKKALPAIRGSGIVMPRWTYGGPEICKMYATALHSKMRKTPQK
jgi:hypothetical protein